MELRALAERVLTAPDLEAKLRAPEGPLTDAEPGPARRLTTPARGPEIAPRAGREARVPPASGLADPAQRPRILHALANHELQAVELFGFALLAFPGAPAAFRAGLGRILVEEQRHARAYVARLEELGHAFGAWPVSAHFLRHVAAIRTPLDFVCAMGLTFEAANLDFSLEHADMARRAGDARTAGILEEVHRDEVGHVAFAWRWLVRLAPPDADPWAVFLEHAGVPDPGGRARGRVFDREGRLAAGIAPDFVARAERARAVAPGGRARR